jgi:hypothetical protein
MSPRLIYRNNEIEAINVDQLSKSRQSGITAADYSIHEYIYIYTEVQHLIVEFLTL